MLLTDFGEIDQAFADGSQALGHTLHAGQPLQRRNVFGCFDEFFDRPVQDRERRVELMRHAGRKQAQADQAVLFFQTPQCCGQLVFLPAQLGHGFVARLHDLTDLVAQDFRAGNQLALAIAGASRRVSFKHPA